MGKRERETEREREREREREIKRQDEVYLERDTEVFGSHSEAKEKPMEVKFFHHNIKANN